MGSPPMSPISPELKEKILNEQIGSQVDDDLDADVAETTFGVDGGVETEKIPRHIYSARVIVFFSIRYRFHCFPTTENAFFPINSSVKF